MNQSNEMGKLALRNEYKKNEKLVKSQKEINLNLRVYLTDIFVLTFFLLIHPTHHLHKIWIK